MMRSMRIAAVALVIAGMIASLAPCTGTTALLTDRETARVRVTGTPECAQQDTCATRTHGFWLAHPEFTRHMLEDHLGGRIECGPLLLTSVEGVLGTLAADPKRDSDGDKRSGPDKARVLCTRQLVAVILSSALSNAATVPTDPVSGLDLVSAARLALESADAKECLRLSALLDAHLEAHCEAELRLDCGYSIKAEQATRGLALANTSIMDPVESEPVCGEPAEPGAADPVVEPAPSKADPADTPDTPPAPAPAPAPTPAPDTGSDEDSTTPESAQPTSAPVPR